MKKIVALIALASLLAVTWVSHPAAAIDLSGRTCQVIGQDCNATIAGDRRLNGTGQSPLVVQFVNAALLVLGAVAVIMLIIGGIRYVVSQGDASKVAQAKNTILYSVIGIIVASLSFAIVQYISNQF